MTNTDAVIDPFGLLHVGERACEFLRWYVQQIGKFNDICGGQRYARGRKISGALSADGIAGSDKRTAGEMKAMKMKREAGRWRVGVLIGSK